MVYVELRSFMDDAFPGRGDKLMQEAMSRMGIVDIDMANKDVRKRFADFVLREYLHYSAQRNRYLYQKLLEVLEIGSMFDLGDYQQTVKVIKKNENIVLSSLEVFWNRIRQAFGKYEVILNLFWLKGVEAQLKGKNRNYVLQIINKALVSVRHDINEALEDLVSDLNISQYMHRHAPPPLSIQVFDEPQTQTLSEPDENVRFLLDKVLFLRTQLHDSEEVLRNALLRTMDQDIELKSMGLEDQEFVNTLKQKILAEWKDVSQTYSRLHKEIKEKFG